MGVARRIRPAARGGAMLFGGTKVLRLSTDRPVEHDGSPAATPDVAASAPPPILGAIALALAYYLSARVGFLLQVPSAPQSVLWLPNSILLAVLLVAPVRQWAAYLLAAFPAQLLVGWETGAPGLPVALLFLTNVADALLGATAVRHVTGDEVEPDALLDLIVLLGLGAMASTVVVSFADAAITVLTGWGHDYWLAFGTRVRSNVLTNVILVPPLVSLLRHRDEPRAVDTWRAIEIAAVLAAIAVTAVVVFSRGSGASTLPAVLYVPLPLLLLAAGRYGVATTGFGLLIIASAATWNVMRGHGPFAGTTLVGGVVALQLFLLAVSIPLVCMAAVATDRRRTVAALRRSEAEARQRLAQLSAIYSSAPVGLAFLDARLRFVSANDEIAAIDGVAAGAHSGRTVREVLPGVADGIEPLLERVAIAGISLLEREVRASAPDSSGAQRDWLVSLEPVFDDRRDVSGITMVLSDITERKRAEAERRALHDELVASYERIQQLAAGLITAQEAERGRIALRLHDDANQQLARLMMELVCLRRHLPDGSLLRGDLARLEDGAMGVAETLRDLSHDLHPAVLRHAGLVAALRTSAEEITRLHGIDVTFHPPPELEGLSEDVALALYRVAQEALRNVVKHSKARTATITLRASATWLQLSIEDTGCGFDVHAARRRRGLGLVGIEERVRLIRGTVAIDALPGHGTTLRVEAPLGGEDAIATCAIG
jgi:PAS domain S-box-containing protein